MVNLHFSLLPRWRGAAPVERAILAGDRETGVCLMKVEEGLDTGPVYAARTVPLDDEVTLAELRQQLVAVGQRTARREPGQRGVGLARSRCPSSGEVTVADKITQGGSPPRLGPSRRAARAGRAAGPGLDDLPWQAADRARGRRGRDRRRRERPTARLARRPAGGHRRRHPRPAQGAAREPFAHVSRRVATRRAAALRASVSGRTRHESSDRDSDRRVEPRPVRAVPFGASATVRRSADVSVTPCPAAASSTSGAAPAT